MKEFALFLALAAVASASTITRYDWYDDNQGNTNVGGSEIYRALTPEVGIGATTSAAASVVASAPSSESTGDSEPTGLSSEHKSLLAEILASTYGEDGLSLDIIGSPGQTDFSYGPSDDGSSDEDDDEDSESERAEAIIADILAGGSTTPDLGSSVSSSASGTASASPSAASSITSMDLAYKQFEAAASAFALAQIRARDSEIAFARAQAKASIAGSGSFAAVTATARATAVSTISSARAEARASVLKSRQNYVSAVAKAHSKVTVMKMAGSRFHALAVAFAKSRVYAGSAILGVKKCADDWKRAKASYSDDIDDTKSAYLTAVASAKARVSKMKVIEHKFLAMTQAYRKARAAAFASARAVRKCGFDCARVFAEAKVNVNAAVETATSSVITAIAQAKATAVAEAGATVAASDEARTQARIAVQTAAIAMAQAKIQVEAIAAGQATAAASASASVNAGVDSGKSLTSYDVPAVKEQAVDQSSVSAQTSASAGSPSDSTDTKAYY